MRRCPTCQSTYTDDSLTFCLTDGAALVGVAAFNPQATLPDELQATLPNQNASTQRDDQAEPPSYPPTPASLHPQQPPGYNAWNPQSWRPAVAQPLPPRRRNSTPWIVGGLLSLLVGGAIMVWAIIASRGATPRPANVANVSVAGDNTNESPPPRNQNTVGNKNSA